MMIIFQKQEGILLNVKENYKRTTRQQGLIRNAGVIENWKYTVIKKNSFSNQK